MLPHRSCLLWCRAEERCRPGRDLQLCSEGHHRQIDASRIKPGTIILPPAFSALEKIEEASSEKPVQIQWSGTNLILKARRGEGGVLFGGILFGGTEQNVPLAAGRISPKSIVLVFFLLVNGKKKTPC